MGWNKYKRRVRIGYVRGDAFGYSENTKLTVTINMELRVNSVNGQVCLRISGDIWKPVKYDTVAGGQINNTLRELYEDGYLVLKISERDFQKLLQVWDEYHLNDVKPVPEEQKEQYKEFIRKWKMKYGYYPPFGEIRKVFPEYGDKWHYWDIPRATLRWLIATFLVDVGEDAYALTNEILATIDRAKRRVGNAESK